MAEKTSSPAKRRAMLKKQEEADAQQTPEDELDEALADSFPASDPPAPVVKGTTANPAPDEKSNGK
jgi:hypothetical protein